MRNDYWSRLSQDERQSIQQKISRCRLSSRPREEWMIDNLTPLMCRGSSGVSFRNCFDRTTLFSHMYEAEDRETGSSERRDDVRAAYRAVVYPSLEIPTEIQALMESLKLRPGPLDLTSLPRYSSLLHFSFRLATAYLSRDDMPFYVVDNPVRKDKVFGVPMVAPSQWKGTLRAAMASQLVSWWSGLDDEGRAQREQIRRFVSQRIRLAKLFGNEKNVLPGDQSLDAYLDRTSGEPAARLYRRVLRLYVAANGFRAGRLRFFPTYFDRLGLEVINPHKRETRSGRWPIYIESVPGGTEGTFTLLYVPFDCTGSSDTEMQTEVARDLYVLGQGLRTLFASGGFGAKTSSGFGRIEVEHISGEWTVNCLEEAESARGPGEDLVRRLLIDDPLRHRLCDAFFTDGLFRMVPDDQIRNQPWDGRTKADYRKVKPRIEELLATQPSGPMPLARVVTSAKDLSRAGAELAERMGGAA